MTQLAFGLGAGLLAISAVLYVVRRRYGRAVADLEHERHERRRLATLHDATIEALALAINAPERTAPNHLRRVEIYASGIARALGMSDADAHAIKAAALLHDIGKLAVPEHILSKPGPLTPEEFQKIRLHPQVGAGIVDGIPFPAPVAPLILNHHERWDGRGYPAGRRGEEIPLGARILGLADHFDGLTANRPFHTSMSVDAALTSIQQEAGAAFDPRVVDAFLPVAHALVDAADTVMTRSTPPAVLDDIARAHEEIYALYDIAQTMGTSLGVSDAMTLIASKLAPVVPFSTCALFLYTEATEMLYCRFATGTDSELIQQLALKNGHGLTGWVARNRRPLVNARPSADLQAAGSTLSTSLQSALVCPLIFGDHFIGTFAVYHTASSFYRDDHRRLLDRVCDQAAAVIHNAVVFEQTQEASLTDSLTGLPNTRFMFMHLARELARAERLKSEVSLLVMDLNDFKEINDNYGHHIGDRALREVAQMLRAAIRPYDICVRYAGDEFIVVLAGCGHDEAEKKKIELQTAVDRVFFEARPGQRVALSISAGAAVFPHDGNSYEALLAEADSRMYRDKSARKRDNQRQPPPTEPPPQMTRDAAPPITG